MVDTDIPSRSQRQTFADHVQNLVAVYRRRVFIYWGVIILVYSMVSVVLLLLAGVLSGFSFAGVNGAALVLLLGAAWFLGGVFRTVLSGRLGSRDLLRRWERESPDTFDRLLTAQELMSRPEEIERLGYSRGLIDGTIEFAGGYIQRLAKRELLRPLVEPTLAIVAGLVLFGTALAVSLPSGRQAGQSLLGTLGSLWQEPVSLPPGKILLGGPRRVPRGASVDLSITVPDLRAEVILHLERRGIWERIPLQPQPDGHTVHTVPEVRETFACLVTASGLASGRLLVQSVDPPALKEISWCILPPAYTRLPTRTLTAGLSEIAVPMGSQLDVAIRADQPLESAAWLLGDLRIPLQKTDDQAAGSAQILDTSPFTFEMVNDLGMVSRSATESIVVIPDQPPRAKIVAPDQTAAIGVSNLQEINALVQDDYGLQRVLLCYEINYQEAQRATIGLWQAPQQIDCPTQAVLDYEWNVEPLRLFPGDEISYYVEAWDNDPYANSKPGRSNTHILRSPSLADVYQDLFAKEVEQVEAMADISEEQHAITEEVREVAQKVREKVAEEKAKEDEKSSLFAERRRLEELEKRQKDLQEALQVLQEEIGDLTDTGKPDVKEQPGLSLETLAKIERIRELVDQLITREGRELLGQLEQVIEQMAQEVDPRDLDGLEFSFEKFEEQLDRTLSQLEAAYQARQLEGLWRVAEQLAEREDRLQRDTARLEKELQQEDRDADSDERLQRDQAALQQRQEALNQDAESMLRSMERLAETMSGNKPELGRKLQQMAEAGRREMSRFLQEAQQRLSQKDLAQAQTAMQQARDSLQSMAGDLQEQFAGLGGISLQFDLGRIMRLVDRTLYLSDQQERLVDSPIAARQPRRSLELEVLYSQESLRISQAWTEILNSNPFVDASVIALLEAAAAGMRKAIALSEGEEWVSHGPAHAALRNINEAVAAMLDSMNSLQQQAAQGSAEGFMEQMRQLIEQQRSLNEQTGRLRSQQTEHKNLLSQLQRMAKEQARIRREIEDLVRRYRHMRNLQSRLDEVAKEMKEVERQLEEGRLDRELDEKQDRILTRMLEAQTSQEQDIYGRERKAERPDGQEGASSPSDKVETGAEIEHRDVYEPPVSQFVPFRYRDLVKRYFRNLRHRESS
jgi:hypothetical protein